MVIGANTLKFLLKNTFSSGSCYEVCQRRPDAFFPYIRKREAWKARVERSDRFDLLTWKEQLNFAFDWTEKVAISKSFSRLSTASSTETDC